MSFQAYLDNIQAKTGKTPTEFRAMATEKGFADDQGLKKGVKAGDVLAWLAAEYDRGAATAWRSWRC